MARRKPLDQSALHTPHGTRTSYLCAQEVADVLQVSPKTVTRWAKEGRLPFMRTLGGHRRYPAHAIYKLRKELSEEVVER